MRVADVGAGRGFLTTRIAAAVGARGHVVATDIDGAARSPPSRARPRSRHAWSAPTIPASSAAPTIASSSPRSINICADRADYLQRLSRALAPGGFIAVSNRMPYRAPLLAAAARAGLRATEVPLGLPAHFFVKLEPTP